MPRDNRADDVRARFRPRALQRKSDPDAASITRLKKMVEAGERRLEEIEDPADRIVERAKLFNKILSKFPAFAGQIEIDGELLDHVSDRDSEDAQAQLHYDREDNRDASDGCYSNDGEGDGEPRIRGLMAGPTARASDQVFKGAVLSQLPVSVEGLGIPGDSRSHAEFERVNLGQVWEENIRDDGTPDEYTGGGHRIFWGGSGRGFRINPKAIFDKVCEMCLVKFKGTKGARYCNECRAPKYCKMRREARQAEEKAAQAPIAPVPEVALGPCKCKREGCLNEVEGPARKKFCSENCRKRDNEEQKIVSD